MNEEKNIKVGPVSSSLPVRHDQTLRLKASPVADIFETKDTFVVSLDLPGAQKETIQVLIEQGNLVIRGFVHQRPVETGRMIHREIGWNAYERMFKLGPGIDEATITAEFTNGVLTIVLPKTEASKARQITVT